MGTACYYFCTFLRDCLHLATWRRYILTNEFRKVHWLLWFLRRRMSEIPCSTQFIKDSVVATLLPSDAPCNLLPIHFVGDRNCLFHAVWPWTWRQLGHKVLTAMI